MRATTRYGESNFNRQKISSKRAPLTPLIFHFFCSKLSSRLSLLFTSSIQKCLVKDTSICGPMCCKTFLEENWTHKKFALESHEPVQQMKRDDAILKYKLYSKTVCFSNNGSLLLLLFNWRGRNLNIWKALVEVKWSACLPSTVTIRVRILLKYSILIV